MFPHCRVGNEDNLNGGADSYTAYRFSAFYDAITAAYPNITVMASTIATQDGVSAGDYHDCEFDSRSRVRLVLMLSQIQDQTIMLTILTSSTTPMLSLITRL